MKRKPDLPETVHEPACIDFHFDGGGESAYPVLDISVAGPRDVGPPPIPPLVDRTQEFFGSFIVACFANAPREL